MKKSKTTCKECPWVIKNKNNNTITEFSKRMGKPHACHMIQKNIWDVSDVNICKGSEDYLKTSFDVQK